MNTRRRFSGLSFGMVALFAACSTFLAVGCLAQSERQLSSKGDSLKRFLQNYAGVPGSDEGKTTRYSSAFVDLNDDGTQEVVVYLTPDGGSGTGGGTTLLWLPEGSSKKVLPKSQTPRPQIGTLAPN